MSANSELREFVFGALLTQDSLHALESEGITVNVDASAPITRVTETDFSPRLIHDATNMASIYVVFFCLENAVRELITDRLAERHKLNWWEQCVPAKIKTAVQSLKDKEDQNRYHTQRSSALIGYTMFGNLAQIIITNWDDFSDLFPSQAWITSRFTDLEMSRNIIMHTGVLPPGEIERIESISRDWLRQVG